MSFELIDLVKDAAIAIAALIGYIAGKRKANKK